MSDSNHSFLSRHLELEKFDMPKIAVKKLDERAVLPTYGSEFSAGADLYALLDEPCTIAPGETVLLHTGIAMEIPEGYGGFLYARSGLATKKGLAPANKVGVIDADYCDSDNEGHIIVSLVNPSDQTVLLGEGKPFAQGIVVRYEVPEGAESGDSRNGGFGSTDR